MPEMHARGSAAQRNESRRGYSQPGGGAGRERKGFVTEFLDDLIHLRASAILAVGVVIFGGLVWYHSGNVFGNRGSRDRGPSSSELKNEVADMERAMNAILQSHTGVSSAAEDAKAAVERQHDLEMRHKAAVILVMDKPTSNLHLAIRNAATRSWCKEILIVHEGQDVQDLDAEMGLPKEMNGKPVRYFRVPEAEHRMEYAKFYACAKWTADIVNVCFYQSIHRDTSGYLRSLWSNFLRAPEFVHSAVGAATYYNDLELTFRETSFGLNAGFAFLNGGAFFLRTKAQNYVDRVDTMGTTVLLMSQDDDVDGNTGEDQGDKRDFYKHSSDIIFTLWVNRPPAELANAMVPYKAAIDEPKLIERHAFERRARHKEAHVLALKILLEDRLRAVKGEQSMATRQEPGQEPRPDSVSSCAKDRCLLITNMEVLPRAGHIEALQLGNDLREKLKRMEPPPECEMFEAHQYYYAVDNNPNTQWVTITRNFTRGDYFGLDLLKLHKDLRGIDITTAHPFQESLPLEVSMEGRSWFPIATVPTTTQMDSWRGFPVTMFHYDLSESLAAAWQRILELPKEHHASTATPPLYIRYVRFSARTSFSMPIIVFDMDYTVGDPFDGTVAVPARGEKVADDERGAFKFDGTPQEQADKIVAGLPRNEDGIFTGSLSSSSSKGLLDRIGHTTGSSSRTSSTTRTGATFSLPPRSPSEDSTDRPSEVSADRPSEVSAVRPSKDSSDRPSKDSAIRPSKDSTDRPSKDSSDRPSKDSTDRPSKDPSDRPSKDAIERPSKDSTRTVSVPIPRNSSRGSPRTI